MNKEKLLENPTIKLIGIILLTFLLILVSIILFEDLGLNNSILIYNIFGTLALISFLFSFHTTSRKLYNELSLGVSRKEFYIKYLKNIGFVLILSLAFIIYYLFIYKLIIDDNIPLLESFDIGKLIYLPMVFLSLSFLGFLLGILKMRKTFFYTLVIIITTLIVVSIIYISIKNLFNIFLGLIVILLGVFNYFLVKNADV